MGPLAQNGLISCNYLFSFTPFQPPTDFIHKHCEIKLEHHRILQIGMMLKIFQERNRHYRHSSWFLLVISHF